MINDGVRNGSVRVLLHVNSKGKLVDFLTVSCSNMDFADAVERAVRKWTFEPEMDNGEPVDMVVGLNIIFESDGMLAVQKFDAGQSFQSFNDNLEYQACSLKNVDRIPSPVIMVAPTYPDAWAEQGIVGKVVVDFYIDEKGQARFPVSISNSHPMLAGIAVAAVEKWKFTPPTRKGEPVLVHAQQVFNFDKKVQAGK